MYLSWTCIGLLCLQVNLLHTVAYTMPHHNIAVEEICEWEAFNATCQTDEVVMIQSARYGRMNIGRCVTTNYGKIGCGTDVTSDFDQQCSGRHHCLVHIISLHNKRSCPKDLKSYLEAGYECLPVSYPPNNTCPPLGALRLTSPSGSVASVITQDTGLGGAACPWLIEVAPYQRINLTMVDLMVAAGGDPWFHAYRSPEGGCKEYAVIRERNYTVNRTVCGGRMRQSVIHVSKGNILEVRISTANLPRDRFLLKYEAFGCEPLVAPSRAWMKSNGEHAVVQCNDTEEAWYLTCKGTEWVGEVGNCSQPALVAVGRDDWNMSNVLDSVTSFPFGILIVVALGVAIGVAVGVMMLVAVLAYMRRRRRRKIRSRSHYTLKPISDGTLDGHKANGDNHTDRSPMLIKPLPIETITLPRSQNCTNSWHRQQRPLPTPRGTSDSGIEAELDGLTMTPESPSPSIFTTFRPDFDREIGYMVTQPNTYVDDSIAEDAPYYFKLDPGMSLKHSCLDHHPNGTYGRSKPDVVTGVGHSRSTPRSHFRETRT